MIILEVLLWLIFLLVAIFGLILLLNLRVKMQGRWHDTVALQLTIGLGPLYFDVRPASDEKTENIIRLGGRVLYRKMNSHKSQAKPKKLEDKLTLKELRPFLRGEFFKRVIVTIQTIYGKVGEKELCIHGSLGFSDPYYTGIMAACSSLVPGLEVEPVFSGPYRDLEFRIGGRVLLGRLVYHLFMLLISREARGVWRNIRRIKKEKVSKTVQPHGKKPCIVQ